MLLAVAIRMVMATAAQEPRSPAIAAVTMNPDRPSLAGDWWVPGTDRPVPARVGYTDETGTVEVLNSAGITAGKDHPFFQPLGTNGRACVTCHQPMNAMSVTPAALRERWRVTHGTDPVFAAIDGSNCPSLPQAQEQSHSLLLERGLFRIPRPWPPRDAQGKRIQPQFTLEVVRDPTGCNFDPRYGLHSRQPMVSVFRRPRPAANLKFATAFGYVFEPKTGLPLPYDPRTGLRYSGNLLADQRDQTLLEQASDALMNHLELRAQPSRNAVGATGRFRERDIRGPDERPARRIAHCRRSGRRRANTCSLRKPGVLKSPPTCNGRNFWLGSRRSPIRRRRRRKSSSAAPLRGARPCSGTAPSSSPTPPGSIP